MFGCCQCNSEYDLDGELGTFIFRYLPNGDFNERFNLIRISNYIHYKVWNDITYPFPNFDDATVEFWEQISNFIHI